MHLWPSSLSAIFQAASCAVAYAVELSPVPEKIEEVNERCRPKWSGQGSIGRQLTPDVISDKWGAHAMGVHSASQEPDCLLYFQFLHPKASADELRFQFKTVYSSKLSRKIIFTVMTCKVEDKDGALFYRIESRLLEDKHWHAYIGLLADEIKVRNNVRCFPILLC
ncbi:uncharacterized protein PHACADRAFT_28863 [Phanerochaete carnosa HHB-10118-sp]|uniref:Uncharacterized protein n=1 Tax=Phanerochaete carnosa (strain HHB-10118-sp) TaxID=650164 RepID=K5W9K1_PHACS|nr:uncharacterized protein PHACADRAFT_28863 [Phanerochaete carnosa HHB-10118-sp]EKM55860.1 hypothetical protein PHACADRAFT_28863 [Phanerochaete carnosa HHB-10118-sp]